MVKGDPMELIPCSEFWMSITCLGRGRSAPVIAGLSPVKGPADPVHLLGIPFVTVCFGPAILAIGAVIFCTIACTDTGAAQFITVADEYE
jgi:hypothetical protein